MTTQETLTNAIRAAQATDKLIHSELVRQFGKERAVEMSFRPALFDPQTKAASAKHLAACMAMSAAFDAHYIATTAALRKRLPFRQWLDGVSVA